MPKITDKWEEIKKALKEGNIVVSPTDTIYGILADALNPKLVEYVYYIKGRTKTKPYIILIPEVSFLSLFGIKPKKEEEKLLANRGITVVFELPQEEDFRYLHRGKKTLAFRVPDKKELIDIMKDIGKPLIAPSANPEGKEPAKDIKKAVDYFKDKIHLYLDEGKLEGKPSTIVFFKDRFPIVLREGNIKKEEITKILEN